VREVPIVAPLVVKGAAWFYHGTLMKRASKEAVVPEGIVTCNAQSDTSRSQLLSRSLCLYLSN